MIKFAVDRWSIPCCCDNGVINLSDEFAEQDTLPLVSMKRTATPLILRRRKTSVDEISTEDNDEAESLFAAARSSHEIGDGMGRSYKSEPASQ